MSCHARRGAAPGDRLPVEGIGADGPYLELARAGRREDFDWLARSQGLGAEEIEPLWLELRTMAGLARD